MINDIAPRKPPASSQPAQSTDTPLYAEANNPLPATPVNDSLPSRPQKKKHFESWRSILATVGILLLAPLFALLLTAYIFQTYQVDGPSMETTLQNGDRLIVWKVPRTWSRITGNSYLPARGDIVVFTEPSLGQFGKPPGKQLIKRVIGLPGDRVVTKDGQLVVYNTEHPNGFQPTEGILESNVVNNTMDSVDVTVPEHHIFVAGDNRSNSLDSRSFGPVHVDNVVGKLAMRILPLNGFKLF